MAWLASQIKWIMLVSGVLTCTMLYAAFAPEAALTSTFGESLEGPVASIVVRNWGALVGLVGLMLVYGAFSPPTRRVILTVAGASKLTFIVLVLSYGTQFLAYQAGVAVVVDAVWVLVFGAYLVSTRSSTAKRLGQAT
jgi:hypothetical protein